MVMLLLTASTARSTAWSLQERLRRKEVAMGVSNGIVTTPINPKEVYNLLGVGMYNGWWDIGHICSNKHGKINIWSYKKPVKHTKIGELVGTEVRGYNGQCGMVLVYCKGANLAATAKEVFDENRYLEWIYEPSTGGTYPHRILDFEGYDHNCVTPFRSKLIPSTYLTNDPADSVLTLGFVKAAYNISGNFTPDKMAIDGKECANWYPGILVLDSNGNVVALVTSNYTMSQYKSYIGTANDFIYFTPQGIGLAGEYQKFFIMSSKKYYGSGGHYKNISSSASIDKNEYIAFFPTLPNTLSLVSPAQLFIHPQVVVTSTSITINFFGTNRTTMDVVYPTVNVSLEYFIDQDDEGNWGVIKKWSNYEMGRAIIPANTESLELEDDYISYMKTSSFPNSSIYRVVVEGVSPSILGDDVTEFRNENNTTWG